MPEYSRSTVHQQCPLRSPAVRTVLKFMCCYSFLSGCYFLSRRFMISASAFKFPFVLILASFLRPCRLNPTHRKHMARMARPAKPLPPTPEGQRRCSKHKSRFFNSADLYTTCETCRASQESDNARRKAV